MSTPAGQAVHGGAPPFEYQPACLERNSQLTSLCMSQKLQIILPRMIEYLVGMGWVI